MTDENLIEAMARAVATENNEPFDEDWEFYISDATAALAAYRQCTGDDGK